MSSSRPASRTASLTVCHDAPSEPATRAIDRRSMTTDFSAHSTAARVSLALGAAVAVVS